MVYETATLRQLAASNPLHHLVALVISRLAGLLPSGIAAELTGSLAVAATGRVADPGNAAPRRHEPNAAA